MGLTNNISAEFTAKEIEDIIKLHCRSKGWDVKGSVSFIVAATGGERNDPIGHAFAGASVKLDKYYERTYTSEK